MMTKLMFAVMHSLSVVQNTFMKSS